MDLTLTPYEEELAEKLLTQPYTFTQLYAGLSYTSQEFWGYIWENAHYSLKQTIATSPSHLLPDSITVRKDDVHLLLKRQLSPTLLQKCFDVYPLESLSFSDVLLDLSTQLNLKEETIRAIVNHNSGFLVHLSYYGMGTIISDSLTLEILEVNPNSTILSLIQRGPRITPVILQEALTYLHREFQEGTFRTTKQLFSVNDITILPEKIDIEALTANQTHMLLTILYQASEEEEDCYTKAINVTKKWLDILDRYWKLKVGDTTSFPVNYLAELTYDEISGKTKAI